MYSLEELASYIGMLDIPESWENCNDQAYFEYNNHWLESIEFDYMLSFYQFDDNFKARFMQEIELLKKDNKLNYICYLMYYILYKADVKNYYNIWSWKSTQNVFNDNGSYMIPVVSLLCGYRMHINNMKLRNYNEKQISIQKHNIRLTCTNDHKRFCLDGIRFEKMIWGSLFIKGNIIQIGRLQYEINVKNFGRLNKYFDDQHFYIYIHIPYDKSLDYNEVVDSLNSVDKYIKKYFNELDNCRLSYFTHSWLLSPEVMESLSENTNIRKFQKLFNIVEYDENLDDFLDYVFDQPSKIEDFRILKEDTSLQKKLKYKLLKGEKLHLGLVFIK